MKNALKILLAFIVLALAIAWFMGILAGAVYLTVELLKCTWTFPVLIIIVILFWLSQQGRRF